MGYLRFTRAENRNPIFVQEKFIICIEPANGHLKGFLTTTEDTLQILDTLEDVETMFHPPETTEDIVGHGIPAFIEQVIAQKKEIHRPTFSVKDLMCKSCRFVVRKPEELVDGLCSSCWRGNQPEYALEGP